MALTLPDNMPRVVVVGGLKGGIGKSTLAMFIALVFAVIYGKRVLYIDADPASQTGYDWHKLAKAGGTPLPFDIEPWPTSQVGELVVDRTPGKYDVVVIDCGGDSDAILSSAVEVCEFALLATTPLKADLRRIAPTFKAVVEAARRAGRASEIDANVVFVKAMNQRQARNEKRKEQTAERLPVLGNKVSYRESQYADAFGEGAPSRAALDEVHDIVKEIGADKGYTEVAA
jgi:chromosome partitioning protein